MTHRRERRLERIALEQRKARITQYLVEGITIMAMAEREHISHPVISRTVKSLQNDARASQKDYIENQVPIMHRTASERISQLIGELYVLKAKSDEKTKVIELIADLTMKQMQLTGDPSQIMDALRAVARIRKRVTAGVN